MTDRYHTTLVIAGSDPSGGAGIQADIKTCTALGSYAMAVITALTAQNTVGVRAVMDVSDFIDAQLETLLDDITPDAVKVGMLPGAPAVASVARAIKARGLRNVVVDPVMAATSGHTLSPPEAVAAICAELLPLADVVTPNIPEAELLAGMPIRDEAGMCDAVRRISERCGTRSVLIKGGHLGQGDRVTDLWCGDDGGRLTFTHRRIDTPNSHGTGCALSSAIAAMLARGYLMSEAVARAERWMHRVMADGARYTLGHGRGPVNHLAGLITTDL